MERNLVSVRDYLEEIRRVDIGKVDGKRRDPERVGQLLHPLARNSATYVADTTLAADAGGLDTETIADYRAALMALMVIEDQPAWAPHLRSRSVLRRLSWARVLALSAPMYADPGEPDPLNAISCTRRKKRPVS